MDSKLYNAHCKFTDACEERLSAKEKAGFIGWNNGVSEECDEIGYKRIIRTIIKRKMTQKKLVDIANYCMFLFNLMEVRKG